MRYTLVLATLLLAACEPSIPDSTAGVGFEDYTTYDAQRIAREAELRGEPVPVVPGARVIGSETIASVDPDIGGPASAPVRAPDLDNPGISDEQDFGAVSARQSIESDAERLARQREAYRVIEPQALPQRSGETGPNIVAFALSTTHQPGQPVYRRSGFNADARFNRACARYATADEAQRDFLSRGGPEQDRMGVDPDGDGFACYWDPRPFRAARGG